MVALNACACGKPAKAWGPFGASCGDCAPLFVDTRDGEDTALARRQYEIIMAAKAEEKRVEEVAAYQKEQEGEDAVARSLADKIIAGASQKTVTAPLKASLRAKVDLLVDQHVAKALEEANTTKLADYENLKRSVAAEEAKLKELRERIKLVTDADESLPALRKEVTRVLAQVWSNAALEGKEVLCPCHGSGDVAVHLRTSRVFCNKNPDHAVKWWPLAECITEKAEPGHRCPKCGNTERQIRWPDSDLGCLNCGNRRTEPFKGIGEEKASTGDVLKNLAQASERILLKHKKAAPKAVLYDDLEQF